MWLYMNENGCSYDRSTWKRKFGNNTKSDYELYWLIKYCLSFNFKEGKLLILRILEGNEFHICGPEKDTLCWVDQMTLWIINDK